MNTDWNNEIAAKIALQKRLMELDDPASHFPPEPPATESQIQEVERHLGLQLAPQYRNFLQHANGWKGFYFVSTLFGTDDLLGKTGLRAQALEHLDAFNPEAIFREHDIAGRDDNSFNPDGTFRHVVRNEHLLPIGFATDSLHMYFLGKENTPVSGHVIEIQGSGIGDMSDFHTFFTKTIETERHFIDKALSEKDQRSV
jgi:hypothetical protein